MSFLLDGLLKMAGLNPNGPERLSWKEVVILGLVPAGQLYARIVNFNGSLDKWWLMFPLVLFPPLSFIPLILMKYGYIENGKGSNPVDMMMLLPIIAKFIIPFVLPHLIGEDQRVLAVVVGFVFRLILIMIANLYRRYDNCKSITSDSIGKAGMDSMIAGSVGDIVPIAMNFIPIVGTMYSIVSMVPVIGDRKVIDSIFWTIGFGATYALINMFNQVNMAKYCSAPFTGYTEDKIPFMTAIAALVGAHAFNYFMGGDLDDDEEGGGDDE